VPRELWPSRSDEVSKGAGLVDFHRAVALAPFAPAFPEPGEQLLAAGGRDDRTVVDDHGNRARLGKVNETWHNRPEARDQRTLGRTGRRQCWCIASPRVELARKGLHRFATRVRLWQYVPTCESLAVSNVRVTHGQCRAMRSLSEGRSRMRELSSGMPVDCLEGRRFGDLRAEITRADEIPAEDYELLSSRAGMFFNRCRLEWAWEDIRWDNVLVAVRRSATLVGLLPLSIPRIGRWPDSAYDVSTLTGDRHLDADNVCLMGGSSDVRASILLHNRLSPHDRKLVALAAVEASQQFGRAKNLRCAAVYVPTEEEELSSALAETGMKPHPAPSRSVIRWSQPTLDSYLRGLSASHREIVRRDWRKRQALGLRTETMDWQDAIEPAAPLIDAVLKKHEFQSHSKLVAMRLSRWQSILGHRSFAMCTEAAGRILGYSFGWHDEHRTTVYEVGFDQDSTDLSHLSYLDLMVYGPIEVACNNGITALDLGFYATEPKRLRGAAGEPVNHWIQLFDFRRHLWMEFQSKMC
jgi:hypothetical protein